MHGYLSLKSRGQTLHCPLHLRVHIILVRQIQGFYYVANRLQYCTLVQRTLLMFFFFGETPRRLPYYEQNTLLLELCKQTAEVGDTG